MKIQFKKIAALLSVASLLGCGGAKEYTLKVKLSRLTEAQIFDADAVYDFIFDAEEQNIDSLKNKSRLLFLKGVDLYKNKKQPVAAVQQFKASILVFPEAKTYYELGNALLDVSKNNTLKEAISAYEIAEKLGFQPLSKVYYNKACVYYLLHKTYKVTPTEDSEEDFEQEKDYNLWLSVYALREAFGAGFTDTTSLTNDPRLKGLTYTNEFKRMYISIVADQLKQSSGGLFEVFIKSFPAVEKPAFEIAKEDVELKNYKQSISYDFSEFIPEMENTDFGREVSHDFFYVAKVIENTNYQALIYSSVNFYGEDMQPVHTTLATFDNKGNLISKVLFSCSCSAEKIKTGKLQDGSITVEEFKRTWEKPISEEPFETNTVKGYEPVAKSQFKIDETGHIVDESGAEQAKDTTETVQNEKTNTQDKN